MAKQNKKELAAVKPPSEELITKVSDRFRQGFYPTDDRKLISEYFQSDKKIETPEQKEKTTKIFKELLYFHSLENGFLLTHISKGGDKVAALSKIRRDFIEEYGCKTPSELMLADKIISAYWRKMRYEHYLHHFIENDNGGISFDQLKVNIVKELHKGIELADREFSLNLTLLKELKQPKLNVKVNAENAYIAQNQQVINETPAAEPLEEIIKPN